MMALFGVASGGLSLSLPIQAGSLSSSDQAEIRALKAQLQRLQQRIEELERRQLETAEEVETAKARALTAGDEEGTFKLPGTDTSIRIGGYIKGDFFYDADVDPGDTFNPDAIPTDKEDPEGGLRFHAKQSRLFVGTSTPTRWGDFNTYLEGDFFGSQPDFGEVASNAGDLRLRHAYGELGGLLIGQTWTNFMQFHAYPTTVDFFGPTGLSFIRQGQLRYTFQPLDGTTVSLSLENPELSALLPAGVEPVDSYPDGTLAMKWTAGGTTLRLAGLLRNLEVEGVVDDSTIGWGLNVSGSLEVGPSRLTLGFIYGDGVGRYIINGFEQDATIVDNRLESIKSWGLVAGYQHVWSPTLRSTLAYGREQNEDNFGQQDNIELLQTFHLNMLWDPVIDVTMGVEWIHGRRDDFDGPDTNADRIQLGGWYFF